jgi:hypothetical protein
VVEGDGALLLAPWPGRSKAMMRVDLARGEEKMWDHILLDEELPWIRRRAGLEFFRPVSVTLIRPCGVESVKLDMVRRWEVGLMSECDSDNGDYFIGSG